MRGNDRFPALSLIAILMSIAGIAGFGCGLVAGLGTCVYMAFAGVSKSAISMLGLSVVCAGVGLVIEILAEMVGVLFAIELNTREAAERRERNERTTVGKQ